MKTLKTVFRARSVILRQNFAATKLKAVQLKYRSARKIPPSGKWPLESQFDQGLYSYKQNNNQLTSTLILRLTELNDLV